MRTKEKVLNPTRLSLESRIKQLRELNKERKVKTKYLIEDSWGLFSDWDKSETMWELFHDFNKA